MDTTKQINIKNRTYYFYNDIINLENFDARLLRIDKKSYKDINIYIIGYFPQYLDIAYANGYIEEKDMNKYLVFNSTNKNKELPQEFLDDTLYEL